MNNYEWKITEISTDNEIITHAKYHVIAKDEQNSVETEGNWWFSDKTLNIPLENVKEENIVEWIEKETTVNGECHILANLDKQLTVLAKTKKQQLPWQPLKINIGDL